MNDHHVTVIISLFAVCIILLLIACLQLARALKLLEIIATRKPVAHAYDTPAVAVSKTTAAAQPVTEFERFLAEDPSRRMLPRKEREAAYRAWRKANGLTWKAGKD